MRAVPRLPSVRLRPVRIHGVDALEPADEASRLGEARAVRLHADDADLRAHAGREADGLRERRADVVRIVVEVARGARRRGASAVLENDALRRRANSCGGKPRVRPERRVEAALPVPVELSLPQFAERRLQGAAGVAEAPSLPLRGGEGNVGEDDGSFARERVGGSAEEMLGRDGEREVGRMCRRLSGDLDADLRRGELLDLDLALAEDASLLPGDLRAERPRSARLLRRDLKRVRDERACGVRLAHEAREDVALGAHEAQLYRKRRGRAALSVAHDRVQHDPLVVAVDAALGPHEGLDLTWREVLSARAVRIRLVDFHRRADGEEGAVVAFGRLRHDGERFALRDAHRTAPSVLVRLALHDLRVRLRVDGDPHAVDGRALHQRRHPYAGRVRAVHAHREREVG